MCADIVQLYCTYHLYYLVLRFSLDLCAAYLDYSAGLTQILHEFAAPTQFVVENTYFHHPPLPIGRTSRENGEYTNPGPANVGPSIPPTSYPCTINCPSHPASIKPIYPIIPSSAYKAIFSKQTGENQLNPESPLKETPQ